MTRPRHPSDTTPHQADSTTFVVGGGLVGREVANQLSAAGATVERITTTPSPGAQPGHRVHVVESVDAAALDAAGLGDATAVVVLGAEDASNLLVAQLACSRFGVERVIARVTDPDRRHLFERLDVEAFDATDAIARTAVELC